MGFVCDFDGDGVSLILPLYVIKFSKYSIEKVTPQSLQVSPFIAYSAADERASLLLRKSSI